MGQWVGTSTNVGAGITQNVGIIQTGSQDALLGLVRCSHAITIKIYQSIDGGKNWDRAETDVAVAADTTVAIDVPKLYGNTIRIEVVGNASATTYFRLGARLVSAGPR